MGGACTAGLRKSNSKYSVNSFDGAVRRIKTTEVAPEKDPISRHLDPFSCNFPTLWKSISGDLCLLESESSARADGTIVPEVNSFWGNRGIVGLDKAAEILDVLGSSISTLNVNNGFLPGTTSHKRKIRVLAFEVANTISKGESLMQSFSEKNINALKDGVLRSEGIRILVSADIHELLQIVASDKREALDVFSNEVIRFGNLCKDPQWHHLERYFKKLRPEVSPEEKLREKVERTMLELTRLANNTSELYRALDELHRIDKDYNHTVQTMASCNLPREGDNLASFKGALKQQKKAVWNLKRKSLWCKNFEEVIDKLVDIVTFLHQESLELEAFGDGTKPGNNQSGKNCQTLGDLALHYANIINQINNIASHPGYPSPSTRDTLYQGLPENVKAALRTRLHSFHAAEQLTISEIKSEMEKTLQWMVPMASSTIKAHQGFGWIGEWAKSSGLNKVNVAQDNVLPIQTLQYASKQKTDECILELLTWLHHLMAQVRYTDHGLKNGKPASITKTVVLSLETLKTLPYLKEKDGVIFPLSEEERKMLEEMRTHESLAYVSKSQEFLVNKRKESQLWRRSKSTGHSLSNNRVTNHLDQMDGLDAG